MTRKPEQHSLDEVRELLRSLEDLTAEGSAPAARTAAAGRSPAGVAGGPDSAWSARLASVPVLPPAFLDAAKPVIPKFSSPAATVAPIELPEPIRPLSISGSSRSPPEPTAPERHNRGSSWSGAALISVATGFLGFGAAVAIWYNVIGSGEGPRSWTASLTNPAPVVAPPPPAKRVEQFAVKATVDQAPADRGIAERAPLVGEQIAAPTAALITSASANEPAPGRVVRAPTPDAERGLPSLNVSEPTAAPLKPPASATAPSTSLRMPASIDVEVGESRPFPIVIDPVDARAAATSVIILGLPPGATLSSGRLVQDGAWSVPIADVGSLKLSVGDKAVGRFELTLDLRSSNAGLIATGRTNLQVTRRVAAAPNVAMSDPVRSDEVELGRIVTEGKKQLAAGNVASARLLFQRAADGGSGESARLLGDTWDPAKLFAIGVRGINGDIERAIHWYERADELGDSQAKARLSALGR
jgi:hypothetical protein